MSILTTSHDLFKYSQRWAAEARFRKITIRVGLWPTVADQRRSTATPSTSGPQLVDGMPNPQTGGQTLPSWASSSSVSQQWSSTTAPSTSTGQDFRSKVDSTQADGAQPIGDTPRCSHLLTSSHRWSKEVIEHDRRVKNES